MLPAREQRARVVSFDRGALAIRQRVLVQQRGVVRRAVLGGISVDAHPELTRSVFSERQQLFHDPYYQRHVVGSPAVREAQDGRYRCEANYAVFRTKLSDASTVFNVGRYLDVVVRTSTGLKFASRECIYDSEMIPNSIIYPI